MIPCGIAEIITKFITFLDYKEVIGNNTNNEVKIRHAALKSIKL